MKTKSILFCCVFAVCANINFTVHAQVNEQDSLALVALYNSTNGPNWVTHDNWLTGPVSNWYGITVTDTRVTSIYLGGNNLTGGIPSSIGNLASLATLYLDGNQIAALPPELGNLANLWYLDLSNNQLIGIPPEFGNLDSLRTLYLNNNQITSLPPEFGNLASLKRLWLYYNQLAVLPPEFGNLVSLQHLNLAGNQITSLPPEFGNLTSLKYLYLGGNELTFLPPEFDNLTSLIKLSLSGNLFTFDDLEDVFQNFPNLIWRSRYSPQANISLHQNGNALSVSAGGTLSNNTYKWYRIGKTGRKSHTIIVGDSVFHPAHEGKYFAKVTNSICWDLALFTDTIEYNTPVTINSNTALVKMLDDKKFTLAYPNPAKNVLNIQTNGSASFSLLDQSGKIWHTTNINNNGSMNISGMAAGMYYLKNNSSGAVLKVIISR